MFALSGDTLKKICPSLKTDKANSLAQLIVDTCPKYNINTADRLHEFIAQVAHESGEFSIKTESMYYSTPQRIVDIWKSRFNLDGSNGKLNANLYIKNPQKLANTVYANRMGNGNFESGDGFLYVGGGYMQLTGRDSYQKYADFIKKDIKETALLVRSTDQYALDSACWLFAIEKQLLDEADADDFLTITRRINGGTIGLQDRIKYYERAKQFIV